MKFYQLVFPVSFLLLVFFSDLTAQTSQQSNSIKNTTDSSAWKLHLKEVNVVARRKLFIRKNDRLIFHIENIINHSGSNAFEALRMTPGVQVQEDQISMTAKSNVTVTINDRFIPLSGESLSAYLKGIPTASIKTIEVITAPSARYDAEGNSGIINIVLKTATNDSWNLNLRGSYTQATYPQGNAGADFNFKIRKLSFFSGFTYDYRQTYYKMKNSIFYGDEHGF